MQRWCAGARGNVGLGNNNADVARLQCGASSPSQGNWTPIFFRKDKHPMLGNQVRAQLLLSLTRKTTSRKSGHDLHTRLAIPYDGQSI